MSEQVTRYISSMLGWSEHERWLRLEERGMALARLKNFCVHTRGCQFASQSYEERVMHGEKPCTCGLFAIARQALEQAEAKP